MKYMLLIYQAEQSLNEPEREACYVESARLARDLHAKGQYLAAAPLHPSTTATSVRVRDGSTLLTDGPFAETREQLAGFYMLELDSIDEAIEWAARIPGARDGSVEVRPLMVYDRAVAH